MFSNVVSTVPGMVAGSQPESGREVFDNSSPGKSTPLMFMQTQPESSSVVFNAAALVPLFADFIAELQAKNPDRTRVKSNLALFLVSMD